MSSHVRVDSSVPRNPKFLRAGAAASWLWLCGLAYCQEGLTDGFIPIEAIHQLGVLSKEHPEKLVERLVQAKLWIASYDPTGWWVNDYLEHNKSADQIRGIQAEKRSAASKGGKASGRSRALKHSALSDRSTQVKHPANPSVHVGVAVVDMKEGGVGETEHQDVPFERFKAAYPANRRAFGYMVESLFCDAIENGKTTLDQMLAALENHKASSQWQDETKIPNPQKWLSEERWNAVMSPPKGKWDDWKPPSEREAS